MFPQKIYYEENILNYYLGNMLRDKFNDCEWIEIENHNNIPELRANQNCEFGRMKQYLIIGTRKTHKYVPNEKTSDYLVPYTSSGCSAMCLYCYLVCNYNKCSYLRLFVNREQMLDKIIKTANKSDRELYFEIGSNSDLVLENEITQNLEWTIEKFGKNEKGYITFPTKFDMIEPLLTLDHKGRTIIRVSVNPSDIIKKVEFGTSPLENRIKALNTLAEAGYKLGLLIAPIVLIDDWRASYSELFQTLSDTLTPKAKSQIFLEVILMTYSYIHRKINEEAFPNAIDLYDKTKMTGRGQGKYCYNKETRAEAEDFLRLQIEKYFKDNRLVYIC